VDSKRIALGAGVVLVLAVAVVGYVLSAPPRSSSTSSSVSPCGLLSPDVIMDLSWNGAGRYVPGINQNAPPWNQPSIQAHITEGWQALCQSQAFVSAIQEHGDHSFSAGGGFVDANDVNDSVAGVNVNWSQGSGVNCTEYQESWAIFVVNGTASSPTTTPVGPCVSMTTPAQ
jgi:hypothetical protein